LSLITTRPEAILGSPCDVTVASESLLSSKVIVSTSMGLFASSDHGASWAPTHHEIANADVPAIAVAPSSPSNVYIEHLGYKVLGSRDSGDNWEEKGYFEACGEIIDIIINPADPNIILALEEAG